MKRILQLWWYLNIPGGSILGLYTLVMIGLTIAAYIQQKPLPENTVTAYGVALGAFAINRTFRPKEDKVNVTSNDPKISDI